MTPRRCGLQNRHAPDLAPDGFFKLPTACEPVHTFDDLTGREFYLPLPHHGPKGAAARRAMVLAGNFFHDHEEASGKTAARPRCAALLSRRPSLLTGAHTEPIRIAAHPCRSRARRALAGRWLWLHPGLVDHSGKPFAGQICALELRLKVQQLEAGLRAPGAALIGPPKCLRRRVWARKAPLQ